MVAPAPSRALPPIQSSKMGPGVLVLLPSLKASRDLCLPILLLPRLRSGCRQQAALPGAALRLLCPFSRELGAAAVPLAPGCKFGSVPGSTSLCWGWGP